MLTDWSYAPSSPSKRSGTEREDGGHVLRDMQDTARGKESRRIVSPQQASNVIVDGLGHGVQAPSVTMRPVVGTALPRCQRPRVPQPQKKPQNWELRIQESFEETETENKEELALLLTHQELRVLSSTEAKDLTKQGWQGLETLTLPVQPQDNTSDLKAQVKNTYRPNLDSTPLVLLFRECLEVEEAFRQLEALLDEENPTENGSFVYDIKSEQASHVGKPIPKPRFTRPMDPCRAVPNPRIALPREKQEALKEAVKLGLQTGQRTLKFSHDADGINGSAKQLDKANPKSHTGVCEPGSGALVSALPSIAGEGQSRKVQAQALRCNTYQRLDSLEESIRELESTLQEFSSKPSLGDSIATDSLANLSALAVNRNILEPLAEITKAETTSPQASPKRKPAVPPKPMELPAQMTKVHSTILIFF